MATVTDRHGNVIREEPDTLEDWKQAAQVEAGIRREFHAASRRLRAALSEENLTKVYTMARGNYIKHTFDGDWGDAPHDYEERYIGWFMSKHAIEQKEPTHSGGVDSHG